MPIEVIFEGNQSKDQEDMHKFQKQHQVLENGVPEEYEGDQTTFDCTEDRKVTFVPSFEMNILMQYPEILEAFRLHILFEFGCTLSDPRI